MKKNFGGLILSVLLITQSYVEAFDIHLNDLMNPIVAIAATVSGVVGGTCMYLIGSRSANAKQIEQQRQKAKEEVERDKQKRLDKAEQHLFMMQSRYAHELRAVNAGRKLTKEELNDRAIIKFNHQTPFAHLSYSRQLRHDLEQFSEYYCEFSEGSRGYVEEMHESLTKVLDQHSILFKNVLVSEFNDEKIALEEERRRENARNIENEKLQQEVLKRECFEAIKKEQESIAQKRDKALTAVTNYSLEKMNEMATYVAAVHANNLNGYSLLLQDLRHEFKRNGLTTLANSVEAVEKKLAEAIRESKKSSESLETLKNTLNKLKNQLDLAHSEHKLSKERFDKLYEIVERIDNEVAVISSDVGNIKNGNYSGVESAPIREAHWQ